MEILYKALQFARCLMDIPLSQAGNALAAAFPFLKRYYVVWKICQTRGRPLRELQRLIEKNEDPVLWVAPLLQMAMLLVISSLGIWEGRSFLQTLAGLWDGWRQDLVRALWQSMVAIAVYVVSVEVLVRLAVSRTPYRQEFVKEPARLLFFRVVSLGILMMLTIGSIATTFLIHLLLWVAAEWHISDDVVFVGLLLAYMLPPVGICLLCGRHNYRRFITAFEIDDLEDQLSARRVARFFTFCIVCLVTALGPWIGVALHDGSQRNLAAVVKAREDAKHRFLGFSAIRCEVVEAEIACAVTLRPSAYQDYWIFSVWEAKVIVEQANPYRVNTVYKSSWRPHLSTAERIPRISLTPFKSIDVDIVTSKEEACSFVKAAQSSNGTPTLAATGRSKEEDGQARFPIRFFIANSKDWLDELNGLCVAQGYQARRLN